MGVCLRQRKRKREYYECDVWRKSNGYYVGVCVGIVILRTNTGSSLHAWLICIVFMYTLFITNACMHTPIRVYVAERERGLDMRGSERRNKEREK